MPGKLEKGEEYRTSETFPRIPADYNLGKEEAHIGQPFQPDISDTSGVLVLGPPSPSVMQPSTLTLQTRQTGKPVTSVRAGVTRNPAYRGLASG